VIEGTEIHRIADELARAFDGDPWHGPPLINVIAGLSARDAAARPISTASSIWGIVLHITAWIDEVHRRVRGNPPGEPPMGDWPAIPDPSEEAWERAKMDLARVHQGLLRELAVTPDVRLWETVGGPTRDRARGTGIDFYVMLHGLAQHNVYHTAQIATIRRMIPRV